MKKTMKVIKKIYKAFGLIVIKYVQYIVGSSKDMIYSSGLTIFPQRARRHPAEFGFQSLDSDLPRRCGNVLEKKEKRPKLVLFLLCGWRSSISSAVVAEKLS